MKSPFNFAKTAALVDDVIAADTALRQPRVNLVGYARVSTVDQSLDIQRTRLQETGCSKIFEEKKSGTSTERPELHNLLDFVREGDVVVVTRIDRLARSMLDLMNIIDFLKAKGVGFKVTEQPIDTTGPVGMMTLQILGAVAQFETALRGERQREGIDKRRQKGEHLGRPPATKKEDVLRLIDAGVKDPAAIAVKLNCSKQTVYRLSKGMWGASVADRNAASREAALKRKGAK